MLWLVWRVTRNAEKVGELRPFNDCHLPSSSTIHRQQEAALSMELTCASWRQQIQKGTVIGLNSAKIRPLSLVVVTLLFSACGVALPSSTAATTPRPQIVSYSAQATFQSGQNTYRLSASASCKQDEQMLGGGFAASDVFEYDAFIEASYPSSATTWTAIGFSSSSFQLEAYVYCLKASVPFGIRLVQSEGVPGGQVACPKGTILLSGGFQSSQPIQASYPLDNGWSSASVGSPVQVYALCASQHITASPVATAVFNAQSSSHQYQPGGTSLACPTEQAAIGGGFDSQGDLFLTSRSNGSAFSGWSVVAGGDAKVTVSVVCWAFIE